MATKPRFAAEIRAVVEGIGLEKPPDLALKKGDRTSEVRSPNDFPLQVPAQIGPLDDPSGNHLTHDDPRLIPVTDQQTHNDLRSPKPPQRPP
jgi:hypothetical protein